MKIAIVVLNFNGTQDTIDCLKSINKLDIKDFELLTIVVDNASTDEFKVQSSEFKVGEIKIIRNEQNSGFTGGNNVGIKYALSNGADYIFVLNNDTILDKNVLIELLKVSQFDQIAGIVIPKIYFAPGFEFHKDRYKKAEQGRVFWYAGGIMDWNNVLGRHRGVDEIDKGQYNNLSETDYASGCAMFIKKEALGKAGLFDERYFLYYEDADLSIRIKKAGFKIIYAPEAVIWHKNAGSVGGSGSILQDYYTIRNRLLFGIKYAPLRAKLALIKESIKLLINGREWQKQGVIDFYFGKFGKGSYK